MSISNIRKAVLACTLLLSVLGAWQKAHAQAIPDAPRPQTSGEWAQVGISASEVLGTSGIQSFTDAVSLKSNLELNVIEQDILDHIQAGNPFVFSDIVLDQQSSNKNIDLSSFRSKALSLDDLNKIADQLQLPCADKGMLCQIKMEKEVDASQNTILRISQKPIVVNGVNISGNKFFRKSMIKYLLGAKTNKPLNVKALEKHLRLLQDNPDLTVETTLDPVELNDGKVNINLNVTDHLPVHLSSFWNNIDQGYYGRQLTGTGIVINNVTGLNDTLMATAITDIHTHGFFSHYEVPINSHGTRLSFDYSLIKATPIGKDYTPYQIRGDIWSISPKIMQTLIAKENLRLSTDLNFDIKQVRTTAFRNDTIEREQIRSLRWGVSFSEIGKSHEFSTRQELNVGLPFMGATRNDSVNLGNYGGGSQFFKYLGTFYYTKELPFSTAAVINGSFQWSPWTLPASDVGSLGGTYGGRGYPEAGFGADSLVFVSTEFHFPAFMIPKSVKIPKTQQSLRDSFRFLTFVDYGTAYTNDDHNINNNESRQVLSTGIGTRIEFSKYLSGRCDLGIPLIHHEGYIPYRPRVHFGLQANVL